MLACRATRQVTSIFKKAYASSTRSSLLIAVHKTTSLVPRVSESDSTFWTGLLSDSQAFVQPPPARILICGTDNYAATQDLVTALLEQPFLSDPSMNNALRERWKGRQHENKIVIAYGKSVHWEGSKLYLPSSFLLQFPFPVEIEEHAPIDTLPETWNSDVPVIVCNPLTTTLSNLHVPSENQNTVLILTGTPPISEGWAPPNLAKNTTLFVDAQRAVTGLAAVRDDSSSSANIQRYQDDYVGSRVPTLTSFIKNALVSDSPNDSTPTSHLEHLRTRRLTTKLTATLDALENTLNDAQQQVDNALSATSALQEDFEETYNRVRSEILGVYDASVSLRESESHVTKSLAASTRQVQTYMDRLTWWKMIPRVDEINVIVTGVVEKAWCKDLENQLIFQSGRLTTLQSHYTTQTTNILRPFHSNPPFSSPILRNTLHQISSAPSYKITPHTLISPLSVRRAQIAQYPTTRLHVAGQQAVMGMGASVAAGAGLGWAGWLGWLSGNAGSAAGSGTGEGLLGLGLGLVSVDSASTSIGLGMLAAAVGIRWGVGKWERAKRKWWGDWHRVGEGLERDLSATLDQTLRNQVGILPRKAYEGFKELAPKRRDEIGELREELEGIRKDMTRVG